MMSTSSSSSTPPGTGGFPSSPAPPPPLPTNPALSSSPLKFNERVTGWITKRSDVATHVSLKDEDLKRRYLGGGVIFYKTGSELHEICKQLDKKKLHTFIYQWENEKSDPSKKQIILALENVPGSTSPSPSEQASGGGRSVSVSQASTASFTSAAGGYEDSNLSGGGGRPTASSSSARSTPVSTTTPGTNAWTTTRPTADKSPAQPTWQPPSTSNPPPITTTTTSAGILESAWGRAESNPWGTSMSTPNTNAFSAHSSSSAAVPHGSVEASNTVKVSLNSPPPASAAGSNAWGPGSRTINTAVWTSVTGTAPPPSSTNTTGSVAKPAVQAFWGSAPKVSVNLSHWTRYFSPYYEHRVDSTHMDALKVYQSGRLTRLCQLSDFAVQQLINMTSGTGGEVSRRLREPKWTRRRMEQYLELVWIRSIEQKKVFFFVDTSETEFSMDAIALCGIPLLRKHGVTREFLIFDSGLVGAAGMPLYCLLVTQKTMMQLTAGSSLTPRSATGSTTWQQAGNDMGPPFVLLANGLLTSSHPVMRALFDWERMGPALRLFGGDEELLRKRETKADFVSAAALAVPIRAFDAVEYDVEDVFEDYLPLLVQAGAIDPDEIANRSLDLDLSDNGYLESRFRRGLAGKTCLVNQLEEAIRESLSVARANAMSLPVLQYYSTPDVNSAALHGRLAWGIPLFYQQFEDVRLALVIEPIMGTNGFRLAGILTLEQTYVNARVLGIPQAHWLVTGIDGFSTMLATGNTYASQTFAYRSKKSSSIDYGTAGPGGGGFADDGSTVISRG